ncbi:MAG: sugar ABC transporter ATP-binding protein [Rectinemataceae bacterium]
MDSYKLQVLHISKSFPGVLALDDISLNARKGSVLVLCGENGAGKSTLMKIINGVYQPDKGEILIDGKKVHIRSPIQARKYGISMIFQELNYIPEMTVEESLFCGRLPTVAGKVDWKTVRVRTLELLEREKLPYSPTMRMKDLSVSDIQMLEILKAISIDASIIIMDEPTSAITEREVERLFGKIEELKARGTSIIYISHRMDEIFRIADDIAILRDGKVIDSRPREELDIDRVISLMVGRKLESNFPKQKIEIGEEALRVEGLTSPGVFRDVSFYARTGEIVGFAGLMGAGRTEVMRAIFGLDKYSSGEIAVGGKRVAISSVKGSIAAKVAMLSEDRRRYGLVSVRSVRENVSLSSLRRFFYRGRLHRSKEYKAVSDICSRMNVKTPSLGTTVEALSGGNQQKVVLGKWMLNEPDILIMDEPTRGIDVGAKYEIYKLMGDLAAEKKALIIVSSELPELIGMCDRIYVMCKGEISGELAREEFTQEAVMRLATGLENRARKAS